MTTELATKSKTVDWSKPIRTVQTDWQDSIYGLVVEEQSANRVRVRIPEPHRIQRNFGIREPRSWNFYSTTGIFVSGDSNTISIENYEEEPKEVAFTLEKKIRASAYGGYPEIYNLEVQSDTKDFADIILNEEHKVSESAFPAGTDWAFFYDTGYVAGYENQSPKIENYESDIDYSKPLRLVQKNGKPPIYDFKIEKLSEVEVIIRINEAMEFKNQVFRAGGIWTYNFKTGEMHVFEEVAPKLENYDPDAAEELTDIPAIDWTKPLRTVHRDWQPSVELTYLGRGKYEGHQLGFEGDIRYDGENEDFTASEYLFFDDDGWEDETFGEPEKRTDRYLQLENYDPEAHKLDWDKPLRTKHRDWQPSVRIDKVEYDISDDSYLVFFDEEVWVRESEAEDPESNEKSDASYFWPDGQSIEAPRGTPEVLDELFLENYDPETDEALPKTEKGTVNMPTAEQTKEKPNWQYPTNKKHDLDETELLMKLRKLVHRNNVESWRLSRIKTEGFGAKRFVVDRRKPVVWRDFKTGKTFKMKNIALHDEDQGSFTALNEGDIGNFTEKVVNEGRTKVWTKEGLFFGAEDQKQFGLFNEELLLIIELTIESESNLTQLLSAVYGDID